MKFAVNVKIKIEPPPSSATGDDDEGDFAAAADETPANDSAATAIIDIVVSRSLAKLLAGSVAEEAKKLIATDTKVSKEFLATNDDAGTTAIAIAAAVF